MQYRKGNNKVGLTTPPIFIVEWDIHQWVNKVLDTNRDKEEGLEMGKKTRYEMDWTRLKSDQSEKLTHNELQYVAYRAGDMSARQARLCMNISDRYLWDLKRNLAKKYPQYLREGNRGI